MNKITKLGKNPGQPHLTHNPSLGVIMRGGARVDLTRTGPVPFFWTALLPIDKSPEPENVVFTIDSIKDDAQSVEPIEKLLNQSDVFDNERQAICDQYIKQSHIIDDLKQLLSLTIKPSEVRISANPQPEKHKKGNIYISTILDGSGGASMVCGWSFNIQSGSLALIEFQSSKLDIKYNKGSLILPMIKNIIPQPDLASLNHDLVEISLYINDVDHNIEMNYAMDDSVKIDYKDAGKLAAIGHRIKLTDGDLMLTWQAVHKSPGDWAIEFTGAGISPKDSSKWFHLKSDEIDELGYGMPVDITDFSEQRCIDELVLNHSYSQQDLVSHTLNQIAKYKNQVNHEFRILGSHYNGTDCKLQLAHTLHIQNRFVRVFWEVEMDTLLGFKAWDKAQFKFKQIRISGIKYIYFSDSDGFDDLIAVLGDDFFEVSESITRENMIKEHEPFYAYVVGQS